MRKVILAVVAVALIAAAVPVFAWVGQADNIFNNPSPNYGRGPAQGDKSLGFQNKYSVPKYGYWGTGPDFGNYSWPSTGPYKNRPQGRPLDALTYAPYPIEAEMGTARMLDDYTVQVSWPGPPDGIKFVDFAILDEVGQVMASARANCYPYAANIELPGGSQKVRVTVVFCDGISSAVFWIPR